MSASQYITNSIKKTHFLLLFLLLRSRAWNLRPGTAARAASAPSSLWVSRRSSYGSVSVRNHPNAPSNLSLSLPRTTPSSSNFPFKTTTRTRASNTATFSLPLRSSSTTPPRALWPTPRSSHSTRVAEKPRASGVPPWRRA